MAGISINILANTRDAVRGVEGVADAVEDVQKNLRDLTRDRSAERLEDDFRDLQRETDRTADTIKAKMSDAYRSVARNADDAADSAVRSQRRMGERSAEVGQEIRQNLGEGIANAARGDFESLADTIGDTLGGTVAGIGGIGTAAAAAAGAAGLGLILAGLQAQTAEAEKLRERLSTAYRDALQDGRDYIDQAQVFAELQDLIYNKDRVGEYNRLLEDQKTLGLDIEVLAGANLGRAEDLRAVQERINAYKAQQNETDKESDSILGGIDTKIAGIENRWRRVNDETQIQQDNVSVLEEAEKRLGETQRDQIKRTRDAAQTRYEEMAQQYQNPIKARLQVDDSALRNYVPPEVTVNARVRVPGTNLLRE